MRFEIAADLTYSLSGPNTLLLNLHVLRAYRQSVQSESFLLDPALPYEEFTGTAEENRFVVLAVPGPAPLKISYRATVDRAIEAIPFEKLANAPLPRLERSYVPYIFPSRCCESDKMGRFAWSKFGGVTDPYRRVLSVCDWIFENVQYLRGGSNASTSACDTLLQRAGVCRDFAHLGVAICRALNLPARYATGYACGLEPPDIHAWFEVAIGGRWLAFDATRLAPANGLVRIGFGRDAADAAIATIFGPAGFTGLQVSCVPAAGEKWEPWEENFRRGHAIVL